MNVNRKRRHQQHREMIFALYESTCHLCGCPHADSIDHVVPVARGGSDHPDNLRPAHTSCNSSKGARSYPEWAENNENMWLPEYAPEKIRAEVQRRLAADKQAKAKKAEERQRDRIMEQLLYQKNLELWEEKNRTVESIRREKPLSPWQFNFELPSQVAAWVIILIYAVLMLWQNPNRDLALYAAIIISGFIFWWVTYFISTFVLWLGLNAIRRTILRKQWSEYLELHGHWLALLKSWQQQAPLTRPEDPTEKKNTYGNYKPYRRRSTRRYKRRY